MSARRVTRLIATLVLAALGAPGPSVAGTLQLHLKSVSPGSVVVVSEPVSAYLLDVEYDADSAEGGAVYGLSQVRLHATGDLTFDAVGFTCSLATCIASPEVFVQTTTFEVTGGDDLNGESTPNRSLISVRVSGSSGYVVVEGGEYLDGTGAGGSIGAIQQVDVAEFLRVPEPGLALGLALGGLALAARTRSRRARR